MIIPSELGLINLRNPINKKHALGSQLMAWWRCLPGLVGGATFYDLLGSNHLSLSSGASWLYDGIDNSINFANGASTGAASSSHVNNSLNFGTFDFTVSFFYKNVTSGTFFDKRSSISPNTGVLFFISTGAFAFQLNDTQINSSSGSAGGADGRLYHIAFVVQRSINKAFYYLNGTLKNSFNIGTLSGSLNNNVTLFLGNNFLQSSKLTGNMYDVRVYKGPMSGSVVYDMYVNLLQRCPDLLNRISPIDIYLAAKSAGNIWNSSAILNDNLSSSIAGHLNISGKQSLLDSLSSQLSGHMLTDGKLSLVDSSSLNVVGNILIRSSTIFLDTSTFDTSGHLSQSGKSNLIDSLTQNIIGHLNQDGKTNLSSNITINSSGRICQRGSTNISDSLSASIGGHLYQNGLVQFSSGFSSFLASHLDVSGKANLSDIISSIVNGHILTSAGSVFNCASSVNIIGHNILGSSTQLSSISIFSPSCHINIAGNLTVTDLSTLLANLEFSGNISSQAIVKFILNVLRVSDIDLSITKFESDILNIVTNIEEQLQVSRTNADKLSIGKTFTINLRRT